MEDTKIIELYFERDERAIDETSKVYGNKLRRLSFRILNDEEDSEEAVSDTYLKTWNIIPPQKPISFYAFIAKICRNICFGMLDYKKAQKRNSEVVTLSEELENCIPDKLANDKFHDEEITEILNSFLKTLSDSGRKIFLQRYWFCKPISEIAVFYNMSESSVKTSLHRSRNKLKKYLETEGISV